MSVWRRKRERETKGGREEREEKLVGVREAQGANVQMPVHTPTHLLAQVRQRADQVGTGDEARVVCVKVAERTPQPLISFQATQVQCGCQELHIVNALLAFEVGALEQELCVCVCLYV